MSYITPPNPAHTPATSHLPTDKIGGSTTGEKIYSVAAKVLMVGAVMFLGAGALFTCAATGAQLGAVTLLSFPILIGLVLFSLSGAVGITALAILSSKLGRKQTLATPQEIPATIGQEEVDPTNGRSHLPPTIQHQINPLSNPEKDNSETPASFDLNRQGNPPGAFSGPPPSIRPNNQADNNNSNQGGRTPVQNQQIPGAGVTTTSQPNFSAYWQFSDDLSLGDDSETLNPFFFEQSEDNLETNNNSNSPSIFMSHTITSPLTKPNQHYPSSDSPLSTSRFFVKPVPTLPNNPNNAEPILVPFSCLEIKASSEIHSLSGIPVKGLYDSLKVQFKLWKKEESVETDLIIDLLVKGCIYAHILHEHLSPYIKFSEKDHLNRYLLYTNIKERALDLRNSIFKFASPNTTAGQTSEVSIVKELEKLQNEFNAFREIVANLKQEDEITEEALKNYPVLQNLLAPLKEEWKQTHRPINRQSPIQVSGGKKYVNSKLNENQATTPPNRVSAAPSPTPPPRNNTPPDSFKKMEMSAIEEEKLPLRVRNSKNQDLKKAHIYLQRLVTGNTKPSKYSPRNKQVCYCVDKGLRSIIAQLDREITYGGDTLPAIKLEAREKYLVAVTEALEKEINLFQQMASALDDGQDLLLKDLSSSLNTLYYDQTRKGKPSKTPPWILIKEVRPWN